MSSISHSKVCKSCLKTSSITSPSRIKYTRFNSKENARHISPIEYSPENEEEKERFDKDDFYRREKNLQLKRITQKNREKREQLSKIEETIEKEDRRKGIDIDEIPNYADTITLIATDVQKFQKEVNEEIEDFLENSDSTNINETQLNKIVDPFKTKLIENHGDKYKNVYNKYLKDSFLEKKTGGKSKKNRKIKKSKKTKKM